MDLCLGTILVLTPIVLATNGHSPERESVFIHMILTPDDLTDPHVRLLGETLETESLAWEGYAEVIEDTVVLATTQSVYVR